MNGIIKKVLVYAVVLSVLLLGFLAFQNWRSKSEPFPQKDEVMDTVHGFFAALAEANLTKALGFTIYTFANDSVKADFFAQLTDEGFGTEPYDFDRQFFEDTKLVSEDQMSLDEIKTMYYAIGGIEALFLVQVRDCCLVHIDGIAHHGGSDRTISETYGCVEVASNLIGEPPSWYLVF